MSYGVALDQQLPACSRLLQTGFGFPVELANRYLRLVGPGALRTFSTGGSLDAVATLLTARQWIGGRPLAAATIGHLTVAPVARGRGLSRPFLTALLDEAAAAGALVATLFASARPVYRKLGFELAGLETVHEAELAALPRGAVGAAVAEVEPSPGLAAERLAPLRLRSLQGEAGFLERSPPHWAFLTGWRGPLAAFLFARQGADVAYALVDTSRPPVLEVADWAAADVAAARDLLHFAGGFSAVFERVRWHGAPEDQLVALLPDKGWRVASQEEWMTRVLDVAGALAARGYNPCLAADLTLEIADELRPGNAGRFALRVREGRAEVDRAPAGAAGEALRLHAGDFASMLTGHRRASQLVGLGRADGPERVVALADLVFGGGRPWIGEHF